MRIKVLSAQEVQALLTFLDNVPLRDQLMIRLMFQCGLRIGEVSALNIEDVWRQGFVHPAVNVRQATTKNHKARYVDIPEPVKPYIARLIESRARSAEPFALTQPLFLGSKIGDRMHVSGIGRIVRKVSAAALGHSVNPHSLRHTYATALLRNTNIRVVQILLGHASVATTEIYTHPTSDECKAAVNQTFTQ